MHALLQTWSAYEPDGAPFILPGDEVLIQGANLQRCVVLRDGWRSYTTAPDFESSPDKRFHLGLLPMPFMGPLDGASAVVLSLNPGISPLDYFGEYEVAAHRDALLENLRRAGKSAHLGLLPGHSWHSAFDYWHSKLRGLIDKYSRLTGVTRSTALEKFAREVAVLWLVPYHARTYGLPEKLAEGLRSVALARDYVNGVLLPRAERGEVQLVVTRAARQWGISEESRGVVVYRGPEVRSGHLSPNSRGGQAILGRLAR